MKFKILSITTLLIFSQLAAATSYFGEKKIENLMIHNSGTIRLFLEGTPSHTETCDFKTPLTLDENNKFFKEMYSALLAAVKSNSKIGGYVSGCITSWDKTYPRIVRIDIRE